MYLALQNYTMPKPATYNQKNVTNFLEYFFVYFCSFTREI